MEEDKKIKIKCKKITRVYKKGVSIVPYTMSEARRRSILKLALMNTGRPPKRPFKAGEQNPMKNKKVAIAAARKRCNIRKARGDYDYPWPFKSPDNNENH